MGPAATAILSAALPAVIGFGGQERANRINQREAAKNRAFQASQANINRGFQERMRNTAWQAAVADMEAAGVNPALAISQGPASSPGGSMGSGAQATVEDSVSSALQAMQARKSLQLLDSQVRKTRAEGDAARALADRETARNRAYGFEIRPGGGVHFDYDMPGLLDLVRWEIAGARAGATNMAAQAARNRNLADIAGPKAEVAGAASNLLQWIMNSAGPAVGRFRRQR